MAGGTPSSACSGRAPSLAPSRQGSFGLTRRERRRRDVVQDRERGAAPDPLLLGIGEIDVRDGAHGPFDRTQEMRGVAPHCPAVGPYQLAHEAQVSSGAAYSIVVEPDAAT